MFFNHAVQVRRWANRVSLFLICKIKKSLRTRLSVKVFLEYFTNKWAAHSHIPLSSLPQVTTLVDDNHWLCRGISPFEIEESLWSLANNKAPGPDGFLASFFKLYWPLIKRKVIKKIQLFFQTGNMSPSWKKTYIALIPKRSDAPKPDHYRPISLCNTVYKLMAKILVHRLKPVLGKLISEEQEPSFPGDQILITYLLLKK